MTHIMMQWAELRNKSVEDMAKATGASVSHLRNIFAGRRVPSLDLAKKLSEFSGRVVPMDAFLSERERA